MKKLIFLSLFAALSTMMFAQQKEILKFNEKTHDFGVVKEEAGRITYTFKFVNTSTTPITLTGVKASCGCTSPSWSKDPVAPGKEGSIDVTYSTSGRPGGFNKSVTVTYTNGADNLQDVIFIKGEVTPKASTEAAK